MIDPEPHNFGSSTPPYGAQSRDVCIDEYYRSWDDTLWDEEDEILLDEDEDAADFI